MVVASCEGDDFTLESEEDALVLAEGIVEEEEEEKEEEMDDEPVAKTEDISAVWVESGDSEGKSTLAKVDGTPKEVRDAKLNDGELEIEGKIWFSVELREMDIDVVESVEVGIFWHGPVISFGQRQLWPPGFIKQSWAHPPLPFAHGWSAERKLMTINLEHIW